VPQLAETCFCICETYRFEAIYRYNNKTFIPGVNFTTVPHVRASNPRTANKQQGRGSSYSMASSVGTASPARNPLPLTRANMPPLPQYIRKLPLYRPTLSSRRVPATNFIPGIFCQNIPFRPALARRPRQGWPRTMQRSLNGTAKLREASLAQVNWGLRDLHGLRRHHFCFAADPAKHVGNYKCQRATMASVYSYLQPAEETIVAASYSDINAVRPRTCLSIEHLLGTLSYNEQSLDSFLLWHGCICQRTSTCDVHRTFQLERP
jgi:hypothetical protein